MPIQTVRVQGMVKAGAPRFTTTTTNMNGTREWLKLYPEVYNNKNEYTAIATHTQACTFALTAEEYWMCTPSLAVADIRGHSITSSRLGGWVQLTTLFSYCGRIAPISGKELAVTVELLYTADGLQMRHLGCRR